MKNKARTIFTNKWVLSALPLLAVIEVVAAGGKWI